MNEGVLKTATVAVDPYRMSGHVDVEAVARAGLRLHLLDRHVHNGREIHALMPYRELAPLQVGHVHKVVQQAMQALNLGPEQVKLFTSTWVGIAVRAETPADHLRETHGST